MVEEIVSRTAPGHRFRRGASQKDGTRIEAIGQIDELNCTIGVLLTEPMSDAVRQQLISIQHDLFDLGGEL